MGRSPSLFFFKLSLNEALEAVAISLNLAKEGLDAIAPT
jgi:hypothetical protein